MEPQSWVLVAEQEGNGHWVTARSISIGPVKSNQVTVLGGLSPGEQIVTRGHHFVVPGDRVEITNTDYPIATGRDHELLTFETSR